MTATEPTILPREWVDGLKARLEAGTLLRENEPLSRHTTLRVGGPADLYVEPASEVELSRVLEWSREHELPWMMIGRGSNLLVRDGGVRGVVICLAAGAFSCSLPLEYP